MTVLGIDLGQNCAAVVAAGVRDPGVLAVHAEQWKADGREWNEVTASEHLQVVLAELDNVCSRNGTAPTCWHSGRGGILVVVENTWWNKKAHGGRGITPSSITPLSAMMGVCVERWGARNVLLVGPSDASSSTGIRKDQREAQMPMLLAGLDLAPWRGKRGGEGLAPHVSDAAFLAWLGCRELRDRELREVVR
jgi:hypothetical protein